MINKKEKRLKRSRRFRAVNKINNTPRLTVYRSNSNIYVQMIVSDNGKSLVKVSASTLEKELKNKVAGLKKVDQAKLIGSLIAERVLKEGITKVAFDRAGYKYHGRVKALAEAAREKGLVFWGNKIWQLLMKKQKVMAYEKN